MSTPNPGNPNDIFAKIQWYAFQLTLLILFLLGLYKLIKAAW